MTKPNRKRKTRLEILETFYGGISIIEGKRWYFKTVTDFQALAACDEIADFGKLEKELKLLDNLPASVTELLAEIERRRNEPID